MPLSVATTLQGKPCPGVVVKHKVESRYNLVKIPHAIEIKKAPLRKREFLQIARYKEPAQDNMVYSQLVILQSEAVLEKQADASSLLACLLLPSSC